MNSSNSQSLSPIKERRRTPMACTNCRLRKLKCRPGESADNAPCERCVKEGVVCEYRPVDTSSASNNHASNQGNPVTLYHVPSAPRPNQEFALPVDQPPYASTPGGYVPNQTFNPAVQAPFQTNLLYPATSLYQQPHPSSYPVPQYPYPNTFPPQYPPDQSNYPSSSQFGGHSPDQYMPYPPAHGHGTRPYDHRGYPYNGYENINGSNSARE